MKTRFEDKLQATTNRRSCVFIQIRLTVDGLEMDFYGVATKSELLKY